MTAFTRSKERYGFPEPLAHDLKVLSDLELASYIAACGFEFDGMASATREALVRLLRRSPPPV